MEHLVDYTAMSLKDMLSSTNPATTPLLWHSPCIHIEVVRSTQDQRIILSAKTAAFHGARVIVARVVKLCQCNGAFNLVEHWWKTSPEAQQAIATVVPSNMHGCTSPTLFFRIFFLELEFPRVPCVSIVHIPPYCIKQLPGRRKSHKPTPTLISYGI